MAMQRTQSVIAEDVTFADFLATYEGQRVEWHAGKVIQNVSNNERHQLLLGFLYQLLSVYLDLTDNGRVYLAGLPMFIADDQPAREPDLLVLRPAHYERIREQYIDGAADVVVEIVSPGSAAVDRGDKFVEYEAAGVPEYWLIDPIRHALTVYALDDDGHYRALAADDTGKVASRVLPGFTLMPATLWQETLPTSVAIMALAQAMVDDEV